MLSPNQFHLVTLGRLTFSARSASPDADGLAKQRRKLAVLAVLALSPRPISRDLLVEMFWSERDERRARHSLSEALSHLRRLLGADSVALRGAEVSLTAGLPLTVDALELTAAADRGAFERAIELYGGPFLHGVYVEGSSTFEEWADGERRRLARVFCQACERACAAYLERGQFADAANIAERWLKADPLSEPAMIAHLDSLLAPGTSEAERRALRAYEVMQSVVEREYELPLPPAVQSRIRDARVRASQAAVLAGLPAAVADASSPAAAADASQPESLPHRHWSPRAWRTALLAGVLLLAVWAGFRLRRADDPSGVASSSAVAVFPFEIRGPAEYRYLREGVVDLLSANLDGAGTFRSVDPRAVLATVSADGGPLPTRAASAVAQRLGAGLYVLGEVVVAGDSIRLTAALHSRNWGAAPAAQAAVAGTPDQLFRLVDRLTTQLLAASATVTPAAMDRLAALTTHSLPALKQYLRGESQFRQGNYLQAFDAFKAATTEDTTFALAHYRLAGAANWAVPPGWTWDSLVVRSRIALAHADRLSTRPRLLVQGYHAWLVGDHDGAEHAYRTLVRGYPEDVEGWYQLGEVRFHSNPMRGRSIAEAREPFERVLSIEREHLGAMTHLLRIAIRESTSPQLDSLLASLSKLSPPDRKAEFHALRAFLRGPDAAHAAAIEELRRSGNDEMIRATAHRIAVYGGRLDDAARVLALLTDPAFSADARAHAHAWMADLEIARGRWQAARAHIDTVAALNYAIAIERRALFESLPFGPRSEKELRSVQSALLSWQAASAPATIYPWLAPYNGLHSELRDYLLGIVALSLRQRGTAARSAGTLASDRSSAAAAAFGKGLSTSLRGLIAAEAHDDHAALRLLEQGRLRVSEGLLETEFGSQALERWTRGQLLERAGHFDQALDWYGSLPEISIAGLVYLGPVHLRRARIAEARGERRTAVENYQRFIELWGKADPELQPLVADARRRLANLASP